MRGLLRYQPLRSYRFSEPDFPSTATAQKLSSQLEGWKQILDTLAAVLTHPAQANKK
jgi:hypothetical protein